MTRSTPHVVATWRNPVTGECVKLDPPKLTTQQTSQGLELRYAVELPQALIEQSGASILWHVMHRAKP